MPIMPLAGSPGGKGGGGGGGKGGGGGGGMLGSPDATAGATDVALANRVFGRNVIPVDPRCANFAWANMRSPLLPCRSFVVFPSASFFRAYCTWICRFPRYWLFMISIAVSLAWKLSYDRKAYPLDSLVMSSRANCGCRISVPKALNVSCSNCSSTDGSRFPTNKLAPTSSDFGSVRADLLTRRGRPKSLIMFNTAIA